jgi:hypothetical protein
MTTLANAQNSNPWGAYMTPSEIHTFFAQYTGSFKMEITMNTGKETTLIKVNSEHVMLLGGRFLEMKQQGDMMGMDYQAITTLGVNNTDKKFSLTTITNMGTGTLSLFGNWDDKTQSATL